MFSILNLSRKLATFQSPYLRSFMFVPAGNKHFLEKCLKREADAVIIDLEDSVNDQNKNQARINAIQFLNEPVVNNHLPVRNLRVNNLKSGFGADDLVYCLPHISSDIHLVYPKVDELQDIFELEKLISSQMNIDESLKHNLPFQIILIVESAMCFVNLKPILDYLKNQSYILKLSGLMFGADDYLTTIGQCAELYNNDLLDIPRYTVAQYGRAYDVFSIDMTTTEFKDLNVIKNDALKAYKMGYTSKQSIHPSQNIVINECMQPSKSTIKWAKGIIETFKHAHKSNKGATLYEGKMVDRPLLVQAEQVIKITEEIKNIKN